MATDRVADGTGFSVRSQTIRRQWILTSGVCLAVMGTLAVLSKVSSQFGIDDVMRDAQATTGESTFFAIGSDLGMYCWVSAIAIGIVSLRLAAKRGGGPARHTTYLIATIGLTFVLLLDDRMMLHERYFPTEWGIPEIYVLASIAFMAIVYFIAGLRYHYLGGWLFLLTSMGLLVGSLFVDIVEPFTLLGNEEDVQPLHYLTEDGLKLAGLIFWLVFVTRMSIRLVDEAEPSRAINQQAT